MSEEILPQHVVLIPDGNRRWAKKRGLPAFVGHERGAKAAEKIFAHALDLKLHSLTFWGTSLDNVTKRSKEEVAFLFRIFEQYFAKLLKEKKVRENNVRVRVLGRWSEVFPEKLKKLITRNIEETKGFTRHNFTVLMAYSGVDEMIAAISAVAAGAQANPRLIVTPELIKQSLWTRDLPPVDLVVRTGGEPHWSAGLMMWDVADAELYFTETHWPAFTPKELDKALAYYASRERRFGK